MFHSTEINIRNREYRPSNTQFQIYQRREQAEDLQNVCGQQLNNRRYTPLNEPHGDEAGSSRTTYNGESSRQSPASPVHVPANININNLCKNSTCCFLVYCLSFKLEINKQLV